jgi:hypothetical protein
MFVPTLDGAAGGLADGSCADAVTWQGRER